MADCDCTILRDPVEIHFRALNTDGSADDAGEWYKSDNIIDWDFAPEIEEGKRDPLRCGGRIKNVFQEDDQLIGGTLKVSLCCEDPEIQYIVAGSVGTITYDESSPPCAIGYDHPTLEEQESAVDYEVRIYLRVVEGSNITGYKRLHFYQCAPTYFSEGGGQQEYPTLDANIKCSGNQNYDEDGKPVTSSLVVDAIE